MSTEIMQGIALICDPFLHQMSAIEKSLNSKQIDKQNIQKNLQRKIIAPLQHKLEESQVPTMFLALDILASVSPEQHLHFHHLLMVCMMDQHCIHLLQVNESQLYQKSPALM
jgi:hypothetical protein